MSMRYGLRDYKYVNIDLELLEAVVKKYMAHHKTALVKNAEVVRYALKEYLEHGES